MNIDAGYNRNYKADGLKSITGIAA